MLRFFLIIFAFSTTVFCAALEETTPVPTPYVLDDQPPFLLDEESETETFEDSEIVEEDKSIQNTTLVEQIEDTNSDVDDALSPSDPNMYQDEGNGDAEGGILPGESSVGGNGEVGAGGDPFDQNPVTGEDEGNDEVLVDNQKETGDDNFAFSETVDPGLNNTTKVPSSDVVSEFAPTSTQVDPPYTSPIPEDSLEEPTYSFTAVPTAYRPPTLRPTPVPYVPNGPLNEDDNGWDWNNSTIDDMEHDKTVIIALSVVFGFMFFFSIFVAYQMLENPDGCCSSICRISVACWCGIIRCVCYPCRAICGCTGQSGGQHMIVPDDGHFTHDLELS